MDDTEKLEVLIRSIEQAKKSADEECEGLSSWAPRAAREYARGRYNGIIDIWNVWAHIHDL